VSDPRPNPFRDIFEAYGAANGAPDSEKITEAIGRTIPFMATVGVRIDTYTPERVVVALPDHSSVHNHVGTPHAAALALLAEAATGLVLALNLSDGAVPLLRSMNVDFSRMARGTVTAEAALQADDRSRIAERPIGKITVDVSLHADGDRPPVSGALQWAWIPESRLPGSQN